MVVEVADQRRAVAYREFAAMTPEQRAVHGPWWSPEHAAEFESGKSSHAVTREKRERQQIDIAWAIRSVAPARLKMVQPPENTDPVAGLGFPPNTAGWLASGRSYSDRGRW